MRTHDDARASTGTDGDAPVRDIDASDRAAHETDTRPVVGSGRTTPGSRLPGGTPGEAAVGTASAVVAFVLVPAVLWLAVGVPLAGHPGRLQSVTPAVLATLLAVAGWAAWISACLPLLRSVIDRVRQGDPLVGHGTAFMDPVAARIAVAVMVIFPISVTVATPSGASGPPAATGPSVTRIVTPPAEAVAPEPRTRRPPAPPAIVLDIDVPSAPLDPATGSPDPTPSSYTVAAGDSLWSIALRLFGDASEWQAIATLNLGRAMPDGTRFVDPGLIRPGWILVVPPDVAAGPSAVSIEPAPRHQPNHLTPGVDAPRLDTSRIHPSRLDGERGAGRPWGPLLPELAALGIGTLGAAALARRLRRIQRGRAWLSDPTNAVENSDDLVDLATLLGRFDGAPVLDWLELANRLLSAAVGPSDPLAVAPPVRLVRVGPDGVDVWFAQPVVRAPRPWETRDGGRVWHLSARHETGALVTEAWNHQPWVPAVVPIGEDDQGTWLAAVEPGTCLPVLGAEAEALVATMRLTVESWPWSDGVVVTDDAFFAQHAIVTGVEGRRRGCRSVDDGRPIVVYIGDPSRLDPSIHDRCATITTFAAPATDLTIAVDRRAVSIHPLGVTLRPHLLSSHLLVPAKRLFEPASDDRTTEAITTVKDERPSNSSNQRSSAARPKPRQEVAAMPGHGSLGPGPIEVRLLVPVPRIDGLSEPLPAKRARRATELVAYLALHHPTPITSDRLRTRVLGSPDADAAAKTLFNVATAARRALGTGSGGDPYLPPALKTGHYRISELVTVDAVRAGRLIDAARDAPNTEEALALYRAALELVEGEPLGGTLSGYAWWQSEGHAGRARALVVQAACGIATLASGTEFGELVEWAIDRARTVDPYSEELSRVAMRWAAAAGNEDRLRREWIDCRRMVDDLDPGGVPSEQTEALYAELTRHIGAAPSTRSGS